VTVRGIEKKFATKSGGDKSGEATRVYNGGTDVPSVLGGVPEVADITCGAPFDPDQDQELLTQLLGLVCKWRTTITVTPVYDDYSRSRAKPRVYTEALLIGVTEPEVDAGGGDAARFELTFAPADAV
jgi:hypothetical protein